MSSPPTRRELDVEMPLRDSTATSVVPPPMLTAMLPRAALTSRPAPMAAATASSMSTTRRTPAAETASTTDRCSTSVTEAGTLTAARGFKIL